MNPDIKAQWIAALRSGEFEQGRGMLHQVKSSVETFCCLGVLCVLAERVGVVTSARTRQLDCGVTVFYAAPEGDTTSGAYLPEAVAEWAGLTEASNSINPIMASTGQSLSSHNDNGLSFDRIADLIEANL